jgi:hypothetical protein
MQRLLKNLAFVTYAAVTACWPAATTEAHASDINSVLPEIDRSADKAPNVPPPSKKANTSIFYLDANGIALPTLTAAVENNIGYLNASPLSTKDVPVATLTRNQDENKNGYVPPMNTVPNFARACGQNRRDFRAIGACTWR